MAVVAARIGIACIPLILVGGLIAGCAQPGRPPIAERSPVFTARPETYVVQRGDTLYSIAWRYELDFLGLARANGLRDPYNIYVGQELRLRVQITSESRRPKRTAPATSTTSTASTKPVSKWAWPVSAPVLRDFSASNKGVDYRLQAGVRVRSAAAGEVVYAGNGLGGYAHLVIIKHSDQYLSAYSLNTVGLVREGQQVQAAADLAKIPSGDAAARALHFEIRKHGEAVNPRSVIGR